MGICDKRLLENKKATGHYSMTRIESANQPTSQPGDHALIAPIKSHEHVNTMTFSNARC